MWKRMETYLSPRVKYLLVDIGQDAGEEDMSHMFTSRRTFRWSEVQSLMGSCQCADNEKRWEEATRQITPLLRATERMLGEADSHGLDSLVELCSWTHETDLVRKCCGLILEPGTTGLLEATLLLTSLLERSLGNVFLMKGRQVPSLIRDLLATPELADIFGQTPMEFLQVLMGSPLSLNLRNVTWHGFIHPGEILPHLPCSLILAAASLGELILGASIPRREYISFPQASVLEMPKVTEEEANVIVNLLDPDVAKVALRYFWDHQYGYCLVLLLPQLEHLLRCVFAAQNGCPERVLTAEATSLYTTLDEILAEKIFDNVNQIRTFVGDSTLELLLDLFSYPDGPRIRDRISHGEYNLECVPAEVCNAVVITTLLVCTKVSGETCKHSGTYKSCFHYSCRARDAIANSWQDLNQCRVTFPTANEFQYSTVNLQCYVTALDQQISLLNSQNVEEALLNANMETLYRSKHESKVLNALTQIAGHVKTISGHVKSGMEEKYSALKQNQLRPRHKVTYKHMLEVVPILQVWLKIVTVTCAYRCVHVNSNNSETHQQVMKKLKSILKRVENLVSFTNPSKNRWKECHSLITSEYVIGQSS